MNDVDDNEDASLVSVGTLVLWVGCLAVGIIGLRIPIVRLLPLPKAVEPVQAQLMKVVLTNDPLPPPDIGEPSSPPPDAALESSPPAPPQAVAVPAPPALISVATPSPAIAFALPTEGPTTRVADPRQAVPAPVRPAATVPAAQTDVPRPAGPAPTQRLTYGEGEGRQPQPEYPREAIIGREQGVVVVRFTVDENGRVIKAEVATPCAWPLLNQAATRAVRETWRFGAGPVRSYEVPIEFQLKQR